MRIKQTEISATIVYKSLDFSLKYGSKFKPTQSSNLKNEHKVNKKLLNDLN